MWTRSAADRETGKASVTCWDWKGAVFFEGEFASVAEAERAGEDAERRMTLWEASGRPEQSADDTPSLDELFAEFDEIFGVSQ